MLTIGALIVIAYLPGAVLLRVPMLDRDRRAALDAEERIFWAILISIAWSSMLVLALAAAGAYSFGRLVAADAGVAACLIAVLRGQLAYGTARRRVTWTVLLPLGLVALGCWLFLPPFEYVIGGKDPGTYINEGIQIAQGGSLVIHDTTVSGIPAALRDLFLPFSRNGEYYAVRFMGFFVLDPGRGTVVGQFPPLFPAWIAIAYGLGAVRGALLTTPAAAILGLLAVYFAGARLLGRGAALIGSCLLALNVAAIWFAREPNSEVVSQALIFGGLLALARAHVDRDRFFAPVAGVLLGLLLFVRIDTPLAVAAVALAVVLQLFDRRRPPWLFVAPLAVLGVLAFVYGWMLLQAYLMMPRMALAGLHGSRLALVAAAVGGLVLLFVASRFDRMAALVRTVVPPALAAAVVAAAVYAYGFRVQTFGPGGLAWENAHSLETFTWYFPPLALIVALAGFSVAAVRWFWRAPALFVTLAAYSFFVFYKVRVVADHFWMARRFIPVILPGASLMAAAAVVLLFSPPGAARRLRWLGVPAALLLLGFVAVPLVRASAPVVRHVEYEGIVSRLETLASKFGPDDLLVVNPRDESDVHILALPLAYIWHRPALVLPSPRPDKAMFRRFLQVATERYRNVYFIGGGGTDLVSPSIAVDPAFGDRFQVPEYESRRNAYPRTVKRKEFEFGVYRFTRPGAPRQAFALDVGHLDDLNVYRFNAKESWTDGVAFRWSRNTSYVALPPMTQARTLTLWMNDGGRPGNAPPARVTVYLNDRLLGTADVTAGFKPYTFPVVPEVWPATLTADDAATLKLVSTTWNPRLALGVDDDRNLGVMVRRIEVK